MVSELPKPKTDRSTSPWDSDSLSSLLSILPAKQAWGKRATINVLCEHSPVGESHIAIQIEIDLKDRREKNNG